MKDTRGFTLVELLMVLSIMVLLLSMVILPSSGDQRRAVVRGAAYELAATIRQARSLAMEHNGYFGLTFNVQNAPDSSGRMLNNRSGGHWYRIVRPYGGMADNAAYANVYGVFPVPIVSLPSGAAFLNWVPKAFLQQVQSCYLGPQHTLPAGGVRFLALTDQDNGRRLCANGLYSPGSSLFNIPADHAGDGLVAHYPRPWFGRSEPTATGIRIHAWGGYEPIDARWRRMTYMNEYTSYSNGIPKDLNPIGKGFSYMGFMYEGMGGTPVIGSRQVEDRLVWDDTNGDGRVYFTPPASADPGVSSTAAGPFRLWSTGEPRPLLRGDFMDAVLVFRPDGSVGFMFKEPANNQAYATRIGCLPTSFMVDWPSPVPAGYVPTITINGIKMDYLTFLKRSGWGDMAQPQSCYSPNMAITSYRYYMDDESQAVGYFPMATNYSDVTGGYTITLAPDVAPGDEDTAEFTDAEAYLKTITPMYRVLVTRTGAVQVIEVKNVLPDTWTPDDVMRVTTYSPFATAWEDRVKVFANYRMNRRGGTDGWSSPWKPASGYMTAEMIKENWWWIR